MMVSGSPVPILMYHSVSPFATPAFHRFALHPAMFRAHLAYLAEQGYRTLTMSELCNLRSGEARESPARTVVLTFDDGFADFYSDVFPVLLRHGFSATLYIVTGCVGETSRWLSAECEADRPMLNWTQLAEIRAAGIDCAAHSHTHPQLDLLTSDQAREELATSRRILEERLQSPVDSFAYPYGFYNRRVRELAQEVGYRTACTVGELVSARDEPFAVPRLTVDAGTDVAGLAALLARTKPGTAQRGTVEAKRLIWQGIRRHGPARLTSYLTGHLQATGAGQQ